MSPLPMAVRFPTVPLDVLLWLVLALTVLAFGAYSAILLWHWKEYSTGKFTTAVNMFAYLGVSAGCMAAMAAAAAWYAA